MKKFIKIALLISLCLVMTVGAVINASAASIAVGKTYFGSLAGDKGAGFKFYYSTSGKDIDPTTNRVALNKFITNGKQWPWEQDGMNHYAEKADGTNAIVGINRGSNAILLTTYIKGDGIRKPMIVFTAPADGDYKFSMKTQVLWSPEELGIEVWAGGKKTSNYNVISQSNTSFEGKVSLKEGQELAFVVVNNKWGEANNHALIRDLTVKYEGNPNAPVTTPQQTTTPEVTTTPEITTSEENTTPENTTTNGKETLPVTTEPKDTDGQKGETTDGEDLGKEIIIATVSAIVGAAIGVAVTLALTNRKHSA